MTVPRSLEGHLTVLEGGSDFHFTPDLALHCLPLGSAENEQGRHGKTGRAYNWRAAGIPLADFIQSMWSQKCNKPHIIQ